MASSALAEKFEPVQPTYISPQALNAILDKGKSNLKHDRLAARQVGDVFHRWHTWRVSSFCSPEDRYGVETNEATVQRKCDNHTIESYKYVKVKMTASGPDKILSENDCSRCHLWGERRETENVPHGGGLEVQWEQHRGESEGVRDGLLLWAPEFSRDLTMSKTLNSQSFLSSYFRIPKRTARVVDTNVPDLEALMTKTAATNIDIRDSSTDPFGDVH